MENTIDKQVLGCCFFPQALGDHLQWGRQVVQPIFSCKWVFAAQKPSVGESLQAWKGKSGKANRHLVAHPPGDRDSGDSGAEQLGLSRRHKEELRLTPSLEGLVNKVRRKPQAVSTAKTKVWKEGSELA